jgi:hypothetical protein
MLECNAYSMLLIHSSLYFLQKLLFCFGFGGINVWMMSACLLAFCSAAIFSAPVLATLAKVGTVTPGGPTDTLRSVI